jgi:septal ring factor EnvC (AmiA/AmiB activator)
MSAAAPDEISLQRNQYREELARVRCEQDKQHALITSLRNDHDRVASENVDLRRQMAELQRELAKAKAQIRQVNLCGSFFKLLVRICF